MSKKLTNIIAIDPGPIESAFVVWNGKKILDKNLLENESLLSSLYLKRSNFRWFDICLIEQVACFGMPVGSSIFETVFWSGRFCEAWNRHNEFFRIPRREIKLHLCNSVRAKDSNITQALIDRFAPMERNKGKGTKKEPGFFYGFKKDIWQAFALAVTWYDQNIED